MSLASLLFLVACAPQADPELELEFELRRLALESVQPEAELHALLASDAWRERLMALDSLRRRAQLGAEFDLELAALACGDPHPNVRAMALELLAAGLRALPGMDAPREIAPAETLGELAADPLPFVRLALVRALANGAQPDALARLSSMAFDQDARVAALARAAIWDLEDVQPGASVAQVELARELWMRAQDEAVLEGCARLAQRARLAPATDGMRALLDGELFAGRSSSRRSWLAVVDALAMSRGAELSGATVIDGWLVDDPSSRRRELLQSAGRLGSSSLGEQLLLAVEEAQRMRDSTQLAQPGARQALRRDLLRLTHPEFADELEMLQRDFVDAAIVALGPMECLRRADRLCPTSECLRLLLDETGHSARSWSPDQAGLWTSAARPLGVRYYATRALDSILRRNGDRPTADALALALADPELQVRDLAFRSLCDYGDPRPYLDGLFDAWGLQPESERLNALSYLPRGIALPPFRASLLGLAREGGIERRRAVELLSAFRGDAEVLGVLELTLAEERARMVSSEGDERRRAELAVMGAARALSEFSGEGALASLLATLDDSLGRSTDVGKTTVALLAHHGAGRAALADYLGENIDRRTRVEAAIVLAREGSADAVERLIADCDGTAYDLRVRVLEALSRSASTRAIDFLAARVSGADVTLDERVRLCELLAPNATRPSVLAVLSSLARVDQLLDVRMSALSAMGRAGGVLVRAELRRLWDADEFEDELLREECLVALAAAGAEEELLARELLRRPLEFGAEDLAKRFRGERPSSPTFRWRAELAIARQLARRGALERALLSGAWWRMDAELALAMSEEAVAAGSEDGRRAARRLLELVLVASVGHTQRESRLELVARFGLWALAQEAGDWRVVEVQLDALLADWRARRGLPGLWSERLGYDSPRTGRDPAAHLEAARWQARAWRELEAGQLDQAQRAQAGAALRLGASERARELQSELELAMSEALQPDTQAEHH